jgi:hypothetical protein
VGVQKQGPEQAPVRGIILSWRQGREGFPVAGDDQGLTSFGDPLEPSVPLVLEVVGWDLGHPIAGRRLADGSRLLPFPAHGVSF